MAPCGDRLAPSPRAKQPHSFFPGYASRAKATFKEAVCGIVHLYHPIQCNLNAVRSGSGRR